MLITLHLLSINSYTLPASKVFEDMIDGLRKRATEPVSHLSTKFGKASRTMNFANITAEQIVLDGQLMVDFAQGLEQQAHIPKDT